MRGVKICEQMGEFLPCKLIIINIVIIFSDSNLEKELDGFSDH